MKIAAIARNPENSPNMAEKDSAILNAVAIRLRNRGFDVDILNEEEYSGQECYNIIYHMSRNSNTLAILEEAEAQGIMVINRASSVRRCERKSFTDILKRERVPQPEYIEIEDKKAIPQTGYPLWLKKSKGWSCHRHDVCIATSMEDAMQAIDSFRSRGIENVLCCSHITGDIVKFYGISDNFFRWHYPSPEKSKFGLEKFNGTTAHYPFDSKKLRDIAFTAAKAIGIEIFGGDCIVTPNGEIIIIDINDFPSFSMYCEEAATAITQIIITKNNTNERE